MATYADTAEVAAVLKDAPDLPQTVFSVRFEESDKVNGGNSGNRWIYYPTWSWPAVAVRHKSDRWLL